MTLRCYCLLYYAAHRKSANPWAHSAIANPQISLVCQSANRKPQIFMMNRKSQARKLNKYIVQLCLKRILKVVFSKQILDLNKLELEHHVLYF